LSAYVLSAARNTVYHWMILVKVIAAKVVFVTLAGAHNRPYKQRTASRAYRNRGKLIMDANDKPYLYLIFYVDALSSFAGQSSKLVLIGERPFSVLVCYG
jgi:hypothetical protein